MPEYKNRNGEPFTEVEVAKYAEAAGMQLEDFIVKEGLTATEVVSDQAVEENTTSTKDYSFGGGFVGENQQSQGDVNYGEDFWNTYQGGNFNEGEWRLNLSGNLEKKTKEGWKKMAAQEEVTVGSGIDNIYNQLKYQKANPNWKPYASPTDPWKANNNYKSKEEEMAAFKLSPQYTTSIALNSELKGATEAYDAKLKEYYATILSDTGWKPAISSIDGSKIWVRSGVKLGNKNFSRDPNNIVTKSEPGYGTTLPRKDSHFKEYQLAKWYGAPGEDPEDLNPSLSKGDLKKLLEKKKEAATKSNNLNKAIETKWDKIENPEKYYKEEKELEAKDKEDEKYSNFLKSLPGYKKGQSEFDRTNKGRYTWKSERLLGPETKLPYVRKVFTDAEGKKYFNKDYTKNYDFTYEMQNTMTEVNSSYSGALDMFVGGSTEETQKLLINFFSGDEEKAQETLKNIFGSDYKYEQGTNWTATGSESFFEELTITKKSGKGKGDKIVLNLGLTPSFETPLARKRYMQNVVPLFDFIQSTRDAGVVKKIDALREVGEQLLVKHTNPGGKLHISDSEEQAIKKKYAADDIFNPVTKTTPGRTIKGRTFPEKVTTTYPHAEELKLAKKTLIDSGVKEGDITQQLLHQTARNILFTKDYDKLYDAKYSSFMNDDVNNKYAIDVIAEVASANMRGDELRKIRDYEVTFTTKLDRMNQLPEVTRLQEATAILDNPYEEFDLSGGGETVELLDGRKMPKSLYNQYLADFASVKIINNEFNEWYKKNQEEIVLLTEKRNSSNYRHNLLSRNYDDWEKFYTTLGTGFGNIVLKSAFGISKMQGSLIGHDDKSLTDDFIKIMEEQELVKQTFQKDIQFSSEVGGAFHSVENFGKFLFQEAANQIPTYATLALPVIGYGLLGTSSMGDNWITQTREDKLNGTNSSLFNKWITSLGYGTAEVVFDKLLTSKLSIYNGSMKGMWGTSKNSMMGGWQGFKQYAMQNGKKMLVYDGLLESASEGFTTSFQNLITGRPITENLGHAMFTGGLFGFGTGHGSFYTGAVKSQFSDYNSKSQFRSNLLEIGNLNLKYNSFFEQQQELYTINGKEFNNEGDFLTELNRMNENGELNKSSRGGLAVNITMSKFGKGDFGNVSRQVDAIMNSNSENVNSKVKTKKIDSKVKRGPINFETLKTIENQIEKLEVENTAIMEKVDSKMSSMSKEWFNVYNEATVEQENIRIQVKALMNDKTLNKRDFNLLVNGLQKQFNELQQTRDILRDEKAFGSKWAGFQNSKNVDDVKRREELLNNARAELTTDGKVEPSEKQVNESARLTYNAQEINADVKSKKGKTKLGKDFKNYQTVEEATNAINNLDNVTPANKAAAIKNIEDGGHGANMPTTDGKFVPFQVVENMAKDDRLETRTHEIGHHITEEAFNTDSEAFDGIAEQILEHVRLRNPNLHKRLLAVSDGSSAEVISNYLELVAEGKMDLKDKKNGKIGAMFAWMLGNGVRKATKSDVEFNFEGETDAVAFVTALAKKIKAGTLTLKDRAAIKKSKIATDTIKKDTGSKETKLSETATNKINKLGKTDKDGNDLEASGTGNFYYQAEADDIVKEITKEGYLDGLIRSKYKGEVVPPNFVKQVMSELSAHIRAYKPERKNDNGLFGWINPQISNKAAAVYNREYKGDEAINEAKDLGETTKEGEVKIQVAAETDARAKAFETEDLSPAAQAKKKAAEKSKKAVQLESEFRNEFGIKTNDEVYNKVLETSRVALKRAYEVGTSVRNIQRKLAEDANSYVSPDGKKLYDTVLTKLGTKKDYFENLEKFRVPIMNLMFTADLVQMEREVADDKKIFTRFVKKLTTKAEVEAAVDQMLLPPSAIDSYARDKSVNVYEKLMPTKDQFIAYFNQPLNIPNPKNPKTTKRSNVRGERKQALARRVVGGLVFDATMQVAQEPAIIEFREAMAEQKGETLAKDDLQTLAAAIGRQVNVNFSISNAEKGKTILEGKNKNDGYGGKNWQKYIDNPDISNRTKYEVVDLYLKRNIEQNDAINQKELDKLDYFKNGKKRKTKIRTYKKYEIIAKQRAEKLLKNLGLNKEGYIVESLSEKDNNPDIRITRNGKTALTIEIKGNTARGVSVSFNYKKDGAGLTKGKRAGEKQETENYNTKEQSLIKDSNKVFDQMIDFIGKDQITYSPQGNLQISVEGVKQIKDKGLHLEIYKNKYFITAGDVANSYAQKKGKDGSSKTSHIIDMGNAGMFVMDGSSELKIDGLQNFSDQKVLIPLTARIGFGKVNKAGTHRTVSIRMEPQLNSLFFDKQNISLINKSGNKNIKFKTPTSQQASIAKDALKAVGKARTVVHFSKSNGASVFDFDETVGVSENFIIAKKGNITEKIASNEWPLVGETLKEQGYEFDFTDFNKVTKGRPGPLFQKMKNQIEKYGSKNVFILTARAPESQTAIHEWLQSEGINIPVENITGLGNSTGKAKAAWVLDKYANENYNDIYFVDDALQNVKAVKDMLDQLDIKGKSVQARVKFSKNVSLDFNKIIKRTTGVPTQSKFSDVQAKIKGAKNKYFSIIPASAQDFGGLLYNFLGKGKQGEKDMAFFKKALIDPFARGIDELNTAKQKAAVEYKQILKDLPDTKKILNDNINDDFTVDQAVRVYLWNKAGYEIPGLSKRDLKMLDEFVKGDAELMEFAFEVGQISNNENGYSQPSEYWLAENIGSDLFSDGALGAARATYLTQWQENSDQIFSKQNLNKIQAIYGDKFLEALEDILYRMKTGRNRPSGSGRLANEYMNWVNGSVGAIMFFNIRSAALQTISATNYINWSDNNPLKAGAAFANQKQFWTDFTMLFNSDYLKQRRSGNQRSVSESELSQAVTGVGAYEQTKAAIRYLLKIGFKPTQIADSFAIASGGASFFRNRTKTYVKQGMSQAEAEAKAFLDFQETTEVSQQSARPDMISMQQASPLGRLILSFQNTPMQYARIMNKAARDLANGRGDYKTHVSKIAYYGVIQSIIFASLQSAVFATLGMDDEDELIKDKNGVMPGKDNYIKTTKGDKFLDKKKDRILHTMLDSWLAGIGYGGKAVSTMKNTTLEYLKQRDKGFNSDHAYTILALLGFSPPIGSKVRKVYSSIQTEQFNKGVFSKRGFSLDNPIFSGVGNVVEGLTNLPTGRLAKKMLNLDNAMDSSNEWWQRVALVLGWSTWDLGIKDPDIEKAKLEVKQEKKTIQDQKKEETKLIKLREKYPNKSDKQIQVVLKTKELFNLSKLEQVNLLKSLDIDANKYKTEKERAKKIAELYEENSEVIDGVVTLSNSKTKEQKAKELKEYRDIQAKIKEKEKLDKKKESQKLKTRKFKTRKLLYR